MRPNPRLALALVISLACLVGSTQQVEAAAPTVLTATGYVKSIYVATSTGFQVELDTTSSLCPTVDKGVLKSLPRYWVQDQVSFNMALIMAALAGARRVTVTAEALPAAQGLGPYCRVIEVSAAP